MHCPALSVGHYNSTQSIGVRLVRCGTTTGAFNNSIPFDNLAPMVGFWDYELTMAAGSSGPDFTEAVTFTVTLYGATRTYLPTKVVPICYFANFGAATAGALCMRYD
jgi:hypothetical protein